MNYTQNKEIYMFYFSTISFAVGVILIFLGLLLPPLGEIDSNVLIATGEFLSFAGALLGINFHYDTQLKKFKSNIIETIKYEEELRGHNARINDDGNVEFMQDTENNTDTDNTSA
ncbi:MAG: hypothetical protein VZR33_09200 [Methanosphaera sp.]|nr:hypothetical protein [Methanosphaera sp.]